MKKVLAVAAFAAFGLMSCKKDYSCDCTYNSTTTSSQIQDAKKNDAETACNSTETNLKIFYPTATCELK